MQTERKGAGSVRVVQECANIRALMGAVNGAAARNVQCAGAIDSRCKVRVEGERGGEGVARNLCMAPACLCEPKAYQAALLWGGGRRKTSAAGPRTRWCRPAVQGGPRAPRGTGLSRGAAAPPRPCS